MIGIIFIYRLLSVKGVENFQDGRWLIIGGLSFSRLWFVLVVTSPEFHLPRRTRPKVNHAPA
jgi:hypothetical protein